MINIYSNVGNTVSGERYIPRKKMEEAIRRRVLGVNPGPFSMVGMQRTGKSSILYNMFLCRDKVKEYLEQKIIILDQSLLTITKPDVLFTSIIKMTYAVIKRRESEDDILDLEIAYEDAKDWSLEDGFLSPITDYLCEVANLGYRIISVVDEFDMAASIFKDHEECFNYMRELAYKPDYNFTYVIASRRSLAQITSDVIKGVSPFPNIFISEYLSTYTDEEMEQAFSIFNRYFNQALSKDFRDRIVDFTGGWAFWVDLIFKAYGDKLMEGVDVTFDDLIEENFNKFIEQDRMLEDLLEEQKILKPLLQFVFGPVTSATSEHEKELLNYGIIRYEKDNAAGEPTKYRIKVFSSEFLNHLYALQLSVPYDPLWNQAERSIRKLIIYKLSKRDGDNWEYLLKKKYEDKKYEWMNLWKADKKIRDLRRRAKKNAQITVVDTLETRPTFQIIEDEWDLFKDVFDMSLDAFSEFTKEIRELRNVNGHNNEYLLTDEEKSFAVANLSKMIALMKDWQEKNNVKIVVKMVEQ